MINHNLLKLSAFFLTRKPVIIPRTLTTTHILYVKKAMDSLPKSEHFSKQEGFELGSWQELFRKERLPKLTKKTRLILLDPPYGIDYKGFAWDIKKNEDWRVNGVDFSYLDRVEDFLTEDGMVMIFNTLRNGFLLQEYLKIKKPNWKTTILYWLKPHYASHKLSPNSHYNVIESILVIPINGKAMTNNWYHSTVFSHKSLSNADWIKKHMISKGLKVWDENHGLEKVEGYEKNGIQKIDKFGNIYTTRAMYKQDGILGLSGNSGKPLTLWCELINYYLATTRQFEDDEYIADIFAGAGSGSTCLVSKIFKAKYWGCELNPQIHKHLVNETENFKTFDSEEDREFMLKALEKCMCTTYND